MHDGNLNATVSEKYAYVPTPDKVEFAERYCTNNTCPDGWMAKIGGMKIRIAQAGTLTTADTATKAPPLVVADATPPAKAEAPKPIQHTHRAVRHHKVTAKLARHHHHQWVASSVRPAPVLTRAEKAGRQAMAKFAVREKRAIQPKGAMWGGKFYAGLDVHKDIAIILSLAASNNTPA